MYDQSEIATAADQLAGLDPDTLVARMLEHATAGQQAELEWEANRHWKLRARARDEFLMEGAARRRLAIDFGAARGWALSKTDFGLRTLGEGKMHGNMYSRSNDNPYPGNYHDQFDHPYFYRRGRKAAAIAAHLYNYPAKHDQCEAIAARFGLAVETPDFPSWWNPGSTRLVVYVGPAGQDPPNVRHRKV
jgi:hypothetical protein